MRQVPWLPPSEFDALRALDQMLPPDTRKFREWFEGSEVVRKTSSIPEISNVRPQDPLVVYHGARSPDLFTAFQTDKKLPRRSTAYMKERTNDPNVFYGAHFTDQVEIARDFAMATYAWISKTPQDVPRVYPVYLSIQNPVAYEAEHLLHYDIARLAMEAGYRLPSRFIEEYMIPEARTGQLVTRHLAHIEVGSASEFRRLMRENEDFREQVYELALDTFQEHHIAMWMLKMVRKAKERLIELGHDGIWYTNEGEGGNGWIAFHANQIKSAIANDGTYGPSKDIRRNP